MQDKSFEYGGHHFIPVRQFTKREDDFFKITRRLRSDTDLGFFAADYYGRGSQKFPYSYDDFYAASTDKKCDIFRCVENGRLYVPCQYELQQYMDEKQQEIPQGHTPMPRERGQNKERRNAYER